MVCAVFIKSLSVFSGLQRAATMWTVRCTCSCIVSCRQGLWKMSLHGDCFLLDLYVFTSANEVTFSSTLLVRSLFLVCYFVNRITQKTVAVWCRGNALVLINAVALHWARLVLGWVRLRVRKLSHNVTSHPGQLNVAIPPWVGAMSTGDGYGHRREENGEFCVAVAPETRTAGILT